MASWKESTPMKNAEDWLSPSLANIILDKAKHHNYRNWLILLLLLKTGRRINELLQLKPRDINYEENMILWHIEKKKDPQYRKWKGIDDNTLQLLKKFIDTEKLALEDYVFYSPYKGKTYPLTRQSVWIFLHKYAKFLGINVHPHTFRHTFSVWITQNMQHPSDLVKLKNLLEHSDIKMTEHYLQFSTAETQELLEKTFGTVKNVDSGEFKKYEQQALIREIKNEVNLKIRKLNPRREFNLKLKKIKTKMKTKKHTPIEKKMPKQLFVLKSEIAKVNTAHKITHVVESKEEIKPVKLFVRKE